MTRDKPTISLDFHWWELVMNVYHAIDNRSELQKKAKKEEPCII
jgi:hypothetical protein